MIGRITAVQALARTPQLRNVSVRLLSDLLAGVEPAELEPGRQETVAASIIVNLHGRLLIGVDGAAPHWLKPGESWSPPPTELRDVGSTITSDPVEGARFHLIAADHIRRAQLSSFSFKAGLHPALQLASSAREEHHVWVTEERNLGAPVEALTEILAVATARQLSAPSAVLTLGAGRPLLRVWAPRGEPVMLPFELPRDGPTHFADALSNALRNVLDGLPDVAPNAPVHVFFVNASEPNRWPERLSAFLFHRIAYLTNRPPTGMPEVLDRHLVHGVRNGAEPLFTSFVPILLLGDGPAPREPTKIARVEEPPPRYLRDLRRIRVDLALVRRRWELASPSFATKILDEELHLAESMARAARALTNHQVGIAISGGGATCYRMVPIFLGLLEEGVPVDVVGGVSGGALIAAYFCQGQVEGLARAIDSGPIYPLVTAAAFFDTRVVRSWIDWELSGAWIGDLEIRMVPVTTALRRSEPPAPAVVEQASLGEAVRRSGSAPVLLAPTESESEGIRFVDGAAATLVPAGFLANYGADLIFAINTVPGPRRRNPFDDYALGRLAYRLPLVGRFLDLWVSGAYLIQQASEREAREAEFHFIPPPEALPLVEAFLFQNAAEIADAQAADPRVGETARGFRQRWDAFVAEAP